MNYPSLPRASFGPLPSQKNRAIRLKFGDQQHALENLLLPQRVDIQESLFGGIDGSVSCVSTSVRVPLNTFIGLPVSIQLVTDTGDLHAIDGIVVDAREGECDGSLATYQFFIRDALSVLERRLNTRIFRQCSALTVIQTLIAEWRKRSTVLAGTFYLDISNVDRAKLPAREQTVQFDESDAAFIRRLCRREGIGWFIRAGKPGQNNVGQAGDCAHTLVLYDNAIKLSRSALGSVAYRPDGTIGERDAVTLLCAARQLVPGSIQRFSWDHKPGRMDHIQGPTRTDQGKAGNDLAKLLMDSRIDAPHIADSWDDYERLGLARVKSHDARAARVDGASGVRDLAIGEWIEVTGYVDSDSSSNSDRQITITSLHHRAENNLPKDLHERAQALFTASRWSFESPPVSLDTPARPSVYGDSTQSRYENTFSGVPRGMPLTPAYDPHVDLPRVHPIVGVVVTPEREEVFCDQYGRIRVQLQGLDPDDHAHGDGVGTSGTQNDSAWVRVMTGLAGDNFGENWLPRKGMEVLLDYDSYAGNRLGNEQSEAALRYEDHATLRMLARRENVPGWVDSEGKVVGEDDLSQASADYRTWRNEQINQILDAGVDNNATNHSTIMTNTDHAEKALAYDVAIGLCDIAAEDLVKLRWAADWRFGDGLSKDDPNKRFAEYFRNGEMYKQPLPQWVQSDADASMPPKIVDERDGGFLMTAGSAL